MEKTAQSLTQPFEYPPFNNFQTADCTPAIQALIASAQADVSRIVGNPAPPTFENTLLPLSYLGIQLEEVSSLVFNLNSAETTPELQAAARDIAPLLTAFHNEIHFNEALFQRIQVVYNNRNSLKNPEWLRSLELTYRAFVRNGAGLAAEKQAKIKAIDEELSLLGLRFSEHILNDINAFSLEINDPEELMGLPEHVIADAHQRAQSTGKTGWTLPLTAPVYTAVMSHAHSRHLRHTMALAWGQRGFQDNPNNNVAVLERIAQLRLERARTLGFRTHADFVLQERMAEKPIRVTQFLEELLHQALPAAQKEWEKLGAFAQDSGHPGPLEAHDVAYYTERLKEATFQFSAEALRPYFPLERVLESAFSVATKLYGLTFAQSQDQPVYHPDVLTFEVKNSEGHSQAWLMADFFPRSGKRAGAWKTSYRKQMKTAHGRVLPIVSIVCNFTPASGDQPSLLTFEEVTTLFHELGHALHSILADTELPGLSGTQVYWDFVELPSQIMENWAREPEVLATMGRHYHTGEPLPQNLIDALLQSNRFMQGLATLRQLGFGLLDLAWHNNPQTGDLRLQPLEEKAMAPARLWNPLPGTAVSTAFSHIFAGGYSAGYYSYKWAEVLDADAYDRFKEEGIFNPTTASDFKQLLAAGGTVHPMQLFQQFRGREPQPAALLKRLGLIPSQP
jgi:peptidyl-dipeptidase Dcp